MNKLGRGDKGDKESTKAKNFWPELKFWPKTYKTYGYIQRLCLYYRKCMNVYQFYFNLVYNPPTSVFDDNIISINYKYFAYGHGKIGDYLIYQKIDLLGVVKEFTDIRYGINWLRSWGASC